MEKLPTKYTSEARWAFTMTEYHVYEPDLEPIEDTEEVGEWLLCMLNVALEINPGNEAIRRLVEEEAEQVIYRPSRSSDQQ